MILTEALYWAGDRRTIVKAGDSRAAYLIGGAGKYIPDDVARKLGIGITRLPAHAGDPAPVQVRDPEIEQRDPEIAAPKRKRR